MRQNLKNWRGMTNIEERGEGILFEKRGKWGIKAVLTPKYLIITAYKWMQYWHWLAAKIRIISLKFTWLNYADFIVIREITVNCISESRTSVKNLFSSACQLSLKTLLKKWFFLLRISSVKVIKFSSNYGFGHIYRKNS